MKQKSKSDNYSKIERYLPLLLGIFLIGISITKINGEDDIYWHIETGKYILENKTIPSTDVFSFATYGEKWIPFEWLWDIIAYVIFSTTGFTGLYVLTVIIVLLIFYLMFKILKKFELNTTLSTLLLFILALGIKYRIGLKPHMFTYLFFILVLYIIINFKYFGTCKISIYFIPVIFLFWGNLHMGVLAGLLIISIYLASETLAYFSKSKRIIKPDKNTLVTVFLVTIFSAAAMLINPNFIDTYIYSLEHTQMKMLDDINEWASPFDSKFLGKLFIFIYIFFLISIIFVIKYSFRKKDYFPSLLCIIFAIYSLRAVRFTTDLMLITFLFIAVSLNDSFRNRFKLFFEKKKNVAVPATIIIISFFIVLIPPNTTFRIIGFNSVFGTGLYEETFPVKVFNFIKQTGISEIGERPFQNIDCGGFFLHNFPGKKNFIDSRNLNDTIFFNLKKIMLKSPDFIPLINRYNFDYFIIFYPILEYDPQFISISVISYLSTNSNWKLIYLDNQSFLFVKSEPKFEDIIAGYEYKYFSPYNLFFKRQEFDKAMKENNIEMINEIDRIKTYEPASFYLAYLSRLYQKVF
ncbi:MAG: hypothetical protein JW917_00925 [Ignavibacteria bacterium]|nr:hypothetical protein [Ignavibacteria bacterium]